jgi:hypothetical protein
MSPEILAPEQSALVEQIAERVAERLAGTPAKRFLSVPEASAYSTLSEDAIRSLLAGGKLTACRPVRGRVVIDKRELDCLILSSTDRPRCGRGKYPRGSRPGRGA